MDKLGSNVLRDVKGQVKWFDPKKGFGFIVGPEGQDVFVHYTQIEGDGFRALKDENSVTYDAVFGEKGWHATRVIRIDDAPERPDRRYARTIRR